MMMILVKLVDIFWFCKRCLINNAALVVLEVTVS